MRPFAGPRRSAPIAWSGRSRDTRPDALVAHGFYRPRSDNLGPQVFQLPPNGWHFAAGHAPKLELLGQSVPVGHASAGPFTVTVETLELRLPVHEQPDGGVVRAPAPHVFPPADDEPLACPRRPQDTCADASVSTLVIVHGKRAAKDRIVWSWQGAGVVDPLAITGSRGATLCVWDGDGLVLSSAAPVAGLCGTKACWSASERRARYKDKKGTRTGTRGVTLEATKQGSAAGLAGAGPRLGRPPLPVGTFPVVAQLLAGDGTCLGATFGDAQQNDERRFRAKRHP